eukprot:5070198-Amphidinium_carterae.1
MRVHPLSLPPQPMSTFDAEAGPFCDQGPLNEGQINANPDQGRYAAAPRVLAKLVNEYVTGYEPAQPALSELDRVCWCAKEVYTGARGSGGYTKPQLCINLEESGMIATASQIRYVKVLANAKGHQ